MLTPKFRFFWDIEIYDAKMKGFFSSSLLSDYSEDNLERNKTIAGPHNINTICFDYDFMMPLNFKR